MLKELRLSAAVGLQEDKPVSLKVRHNVIRSVDGRVKYKVFRPGGKEHYHLGVWIDAEVQDFAVPDKPGVGPAPIIADADRSGAIDHAYGVFLPSLDYPGLVTHSHDPL